MTIDPATVAWKRAAKKHLDNLEAAQSDLRALFKEHPGPVGAHDTMFHRGLQGLGEVAALLRGVGT